MTAEPRRAYAIVAGGGTGGHVMPGLAIARALVAAGHDPATVHYVGSARGLEARIVPGTGFPLTLLPGRGIQRRLTFANVGAVLGLLWGLVRAVALVAARRPRVVIALGGYASVPVALAAVLWRVPVVVAEQNIVPGAANRLIGRFARASAVSFEGTPLPRAELTGNPVRPEIVEAATLSPASARETLGIPEGRVVVLAYGGSLGALRINRAVVGALTAWRDRSDLAVWHVIGDRDLEVITSELPDLDGAALWYRPVRFEDRLPLVLAAADVAVTRSSSGNLAELSVVGRAAVLVPSPHVTADHQTANAAAAVAAGAAVLVPDQALTTDRLVAEVEALVADPMRRSAMAASALALGRPDAAAAVAALVERCAR